MQEKPSFGLCAAILAAALLCVGCAAGEDSSPGGLTDADIEAVKAVNRSYPAAWLMDDRKLILSLFTEDAVLLPHHGDPPVVGLAAIEEHFWPAGGPSITVTEFTMEPREVSGAGSHASVWGRISLAFTFESGGQVQSLRNAGNYLMVLDRNPEGDWRISRYIWNDPVPRTG